MKNAFFVTTVSAAALLITGCMSTRNITPQYISPNNYQGYDCFKLSQEYNRISTYAEGIRKQPSKLSAKGMNIGMYGNRHGIYPTISVGLGSTESKQARNNKLSRLYGERDAIIQAGRLKGCGFSQDLKVFGEE